MASEEDKKGDYDIGYGKPPKHSQWKKGQSGNPSGKRKRDESLREKMFTLLGEEIPVNYKGSPTSMTRDLAMLHAVVGKAMNGEAKAVEYVTKMYERAEREPVAAPPLKLTPGDINVLDTRADWVALIEKAKADLESQEDDDETLGQ